MPNIGHRHWSWLGGVAMLLAAAAVLWGWGRPPAGVPPIAADDSSFAALRESRTPAAAAPAPDAALELRTQRHWALAIVSIRCVIWPPRVIAKRPVGWRSNTAIATPWR